MFKTKILITGQEGFIGEHLLDALQDDYDIMGYDLELGEDIRDRFKLDKLFNEFLPDVVIHMAARAGVRTGEEYPDEFISTNIIGTQNVVDMCKKYKLKQLIFFSSSSVLGGNSDNNPLKEDGEYNPKSLYAITKVAGEMIVKNSNVPSTIIRPFTVYGENGRKDMVIYKWINEIESAKPISIYGDGKTKRGYTYVKDLCWGVKKCILNHDAFFKIIHLGGSEIIKLDDIIKIFFEHCKKQDIQIYVNELDKPEADVDESWTDSELANKLFGFNPSKNFKNNLNKILKQELYG